MLVLSPLVIQALMFPLVEPCNPKTQSDFCTRRTNSIHQEHIRPWITPPPRINSPDSHFNTLSNERHLVYLRNPTGETAGHWGSQTACSQHSQENDQNIINLLTVTFPALVYSGGSALMLTQTSIVSSVSILAMNRQRRGRAQQTRYAAETRPTVGSS